MSSWAQLRQQRHWITRSVLVNNAHYFCSLSVVTHRQLDIDWLWFDTTRPVGVSEKTCKMCFSRWRPSVNRIGLCRSVIGLLDRTAGAPTSSSIQRPRRAATLSASHSSNITNAENLLAENQLRCLEFVGDQQMVGVRLWVIRKPTQTRIQCSRTNSSVLV